MNKQLERTIYDPRIKELLLDIRSVVEQGRNVESNLEKLLKKGSDELSELRAILQDEVRLNDYVLEDLSKTLSSKLTGKKVKRKYSIVLKCETCAASEERKEISKIIEEVPVDRYIYEADFLEGGEHELFNIGSECRNPGCDGRLITTSSSNMLYPIHDAIIYAIPVRVKSVGEYCDKLVDFLFFSEADGKGIRSLSDRYAFSIIVNHPNGHTESEMRKIFQRDYGIGLKGTEVGDALCYGMMQTLSKAGLDVGTPQDNIKKPKQRVNRKGEVEFYKMLQFPVFYKGREFECQIKTKDTFLKERDRESGLYHDTYREIENRRRQEQYRIEPARMIVRAQLGRMFGE